MRKNIKSESHTFGKQSFPFPPSREETNRKIQKIYIPKMILFFKQMKMLEIPYTPLTRKIKKYFDKIQEVEVPKKVDRKWLASLGFRSGYDSYILTIWKFIGFIDSSGVPTEFWRKYKNPKEAGKVLAKAIMQGYKKLFETYSDAYRKDRETLYAFFSSETGKEKAKINLMVTTFINLCQLADFEGVALETPGKAEEREEEARIVSLPIPSGVTLNVNIQLTLPATDDASVYDKIFKALKEHLLSRS